MLEPLNVRAKFLSDFEVDTIQQTGSDEMICHAAWVSTRDALSPPNPEQFMFKTSDQEKKERGVLSFLIKNRHGSPFEHGSLTLRVHAPIFVWREWHRHRIGFSYNESSGRYKQLEPIFYLPGEERRKTCMKPEGFKPSSPSYHDFLPCNDSDWDEQNEFLRSHYFHSYDLYEMRLKRGFDNGLARVCLPVGIYSECYVTCNPRSLMAFLELRVDNRDSSRRSYPQWEIDRVAQKVEDIFAQYWPVTYELWNLNGRMAP